MVCALSRLNLKRPCQHFHAYSVSISSIQFENALKILIFSKSSFNPLTGSDVVSAISWGETKLLLSCQYITQDLITCFISSPYPIEPWCEMNFRLSRTTIFAFFFLCPLSGQTARHFKSQPFICDLIAFNVFFMGNNASVTGIHPPTIVEIPDHLVKTFSPNMVRNRNIFCGYEVLLTFDDRAFRMEQSIGRHQRREDGLGWCLFKIQEGIFMWIFYWREDPQSTAAKYNKATNFGLSTTSISCPWIKELMSSWVYPKKNPFHSRRSKSLEIPCQLSRACF